MVSQCLSFFPAVPFSLSLSLTHYQKEKEEKWPLGIVVTQVLSPSYNPDGKRRRKAGREGVREGGKRKNSWDDEDTLMRQSRVNCSG